MTKVLYKELMEKCDYLEECGSLNIAVLELFNSEDNTVIITLEEDHLAIVNLYDEVKFDDGLIIIENRAFEAFVKTKVTF